jgi:perosamine synthetase
MNQKTTLTLASATAATVNFAAAKTESLAVSGGPKAVTFPLKEHEALVDWPRYGVEEKTRVCELIDTNKFYEELPVLEKEWKDYHQSPFVKSHHNGTSVLASMYFALSLDFPPGSEILVPSQTFFATIMPMRILGFVPVFVDCDPRTANFDLAHAAKVITSKTVALVPVHWGGLPCDLDSLMAFAKEKGLVLCEDCAHCHGASMHGKKLGTFGQMSIFSFQATKPLPSIEGGMGMYQTREYYERATAFGHYEAPPKFGDGSAYRQYEGTGFGQKLRMHPLAAALARMQLMKLDKMNEGVNRRVRQLNNRIKHLPGLREPVCPVDAERVYYNHNTWFLDADKAGFTRDQLCKALRDEGVKATAGDYRQQHTCKVYHEAKWWHHAPAIPARLPGSDQISASRFHVALFYEDQPELTDQYAQAFEKVWAHKDEVAKL